MLDITDSQAGEQARSLGGTAYRSKLDYALEYARHGMRVYPMHDAVGGNCSCKQDCKLPGRHSQINDWDKQATIDEDTIRGWWVKWPNANIGIRCGKAFDLAVIRVNGKKDLDTLRGLGELPPTPQVIRYGGRAIIDYYFKHSAGLPDNIEFAPGLMIINSASVVGNGSIVNDARYSFAPGCGLDVVTPAALPDWVFERVAIAGSEHANDSSAKGHSNVPLQWGQYYLGRGWQPLALRPGTKKPFTNAWPERRLASEDLPQEFSDPHSNLGIMLGNNLYDVDLDCGETRTLADWFLPSTGAEFGRESSPRSHRLFKCAGDDNGIKQFRDPILGNDAAKVMLLELRGKGGQTMAPPSRHPSGELVEWNTKEIDPAEISYDELLRCAGTTAAGALLARYYPAAGARHQASLALAGALLSGGFDAGQAMKFIGAIACLADDEEWKDRMAAVASTKRRLDAGEPATGNPACKELFGDKVWSTARSWLGLRADAEPSKGKNAWPEPQPIEGALPPVPAMTADMLPPQLRDFAADVAERMSVPLDIVGATLLIAITPLLGRKVAIRPKQHDDWSVYPTLWAAVIARAGVLRKTPSMKKGMAALERLEREERERMKSEGFDFEMRNFKLKACRDEMGKAAKACLEEALAGKTKREAERVGLREEFEDLISQQPRRVIVNDTTVEKLSEIYQRNPALLLFRDELSGLLASFDREGREGDRQYYLESWENSGALRTDRITRGSSVIGERFLSIIGSIQPGPLARYLNEAFARGNDGFIARFQFLIWPDEGFRPNIDRPPADAAQVKIDNLFRQLWNFHPDSLLAETDVHDKITRFVRFSPEAQARFNEWLNKLDARLAANDGREHPIFVEHLSKYRSLNPKLALIFHVIANLARANPDRQVSLASEELAIKWCDEYLESHARRVYYSVINKAQVGARALADKLLQKQLPPVFKQREVYQHHWSGLNTKEDAELALEILHDGGWIAPEERDRRSVFYHVNPKIFATGGAARAER